MRSGTARAAIVASVVIGLSLTCVSQSGAALGSRAKREAAQLGMDTYFVYNCQSVALIDQWAKTQVDAFKALGANAIGIGFPLYTANLKSNDVFTKLQCNPDGPKSPYQTPPPAVVAGVVEIAHAAGLQVLLRPMLDQENLYAQNPKWWRGELDPTDPTLWIQNYLSTLRPYLVMAQQTHVEHFAIETELASLLAKSFWNPAIAFTRAIYKGDLVFNYPWVYTGKYVARADTTTSLDTYPTTKAGPNSSVKQLLAQWNLLLLTNKKYEVPNPLLSEATIDEIGISAQWGAYHFPAQGVLPLRTHPFNQWIQMKWFAAACSFAKQHEMQGIYYWGAWLTTSGGQLPTTPDTASPLYIQPGGAMAIKRCFSSGNDW